MTASVQVMCRVVSMVEAVMPEAIVAELADHVANGAAAV